MKVYTKKNNGLRLLGEGMVFSKGQLMLKEEGVIAQANKDGQDFESESEAVNSINQTLQKPGVDGVVLNKKDTPIARNTPYNKQLDDTQTVIQKNQLNTSTLTDLVKDGNGEVLVKNNNGGIENSSVAPRKVMDEMRANSVPFTKTELTKFLKSI